MWGRNKLNHGSIIKDLFFNEINLLTDDINKETGFLYDQLDSTIKR